MNKFDTPIDLLACEEVDRLTQSMQDYEMITGNFIFHFMECCMDKLKSEKNTRAIRSIIESIYETLECDVPESVSEVLLQNPWSFATQLLMEMQEYYATGKEL